MLTIQVKFLETDTLEDCVKQATEFARRNDCCIEFEKDGVKQDITPYTLGELKQQEFLLNQKKELIDMENIYHKKLYMESNLFDCAKFGDKFATRDGRMAIYNGKSIDRYWFIVERHPWNLIGFNSIGCHSGLKEPIDIVSRWVDQIDEEKIKNLFVERIQKFPVLDPKMDLSKAYYKGFYEGYMAAKQE